MHLPTMFEETNMLGKARQALQTHPRSITMVVNPRSAGGVNDFSSEGDYWWPDIDNLDGPYHRRDGVSNPDQFMAHRELMVGMAEDVAALASAYHLTSEPCFIQAASAHLAAWFIEPATRMNPHLNFGQAIHGRCSGRDIGIIDTVHLCEVAVVLRALESDLPAFVTKGVRDWFAQYLEWLTSSEMGCSEQRKTNNHGTAWHLQVACFAAATDQYATMDYLRQNFGGLLASQMARDGSFPLELARTRPYNYSLFNLDIFCALSVVLGAGETHLLESLIPAFEYHAPFVADKTRWPHKHDITFWEEWPLRHAFLYFAGHALGCREWIDLWHSLPEKTNSFEAKRNLPIRNLGLWFHRFP